MTKVAVTETYLTDIADAIRQQTGSVDTYKPSEMAGAILDIPSGGASNFVQGSFTSGSSTGAQTITIPYTGTGYPVMAVVVVKGGAYASGTDWYNSLQRQAIGQWTLTKSDMSSTPTYGSSGTQNNGVITAIYKNSTSSSTSYTRTSTMSANVYSSSSASGSASTSFRFISNTELSVYTATSGYGVLPNTDYEYFIVYSS